MQLFSSQWNQFYHLMTHASITIHVCIQQLHMPTKYNQTFEMRIICRYYQNIQSLPKIGDHEMATYLREVYQVCCMCCISSLVRYGTARFKLDTRECSTRVCFVTCSECFCEIWCVYNYCTRNCRA